MLQRRRGCLSILLLCFFSPLTQAFVTHSPTKRNNKFATQTSLLDPIPTWQSSRRNKKCDSLSLSINDAVSAVDAEIVLDFAGTILVGLGAIPLAEIIYNTTNLAAAAGDRDNNNDDDSSSWSFETSTIYEIANGISRAAWVFGIVTASIVVFNVLHLTDIEIPEPNNLRETAAKAGVTVWGALTLQSVKTWWFSQRVAQNTDRIGRVTLIDRFLDFVIAGVACFFVLDFLEIDIGPGLRSLFAAGGIGALVFSLASKDLAEQIVGGLVIAAWDVFEEGDEVILGDGLEGVVKRIGLVDTEIQGYDNVVVKIPNSQLINQKVSNISLLKLSQIKQTLRFKYSDISKVPSVLEDIKQEIKDSCEHLISDGSKPFRANLVNYEEDHLQVVVNCHFKLQPGSAGYAQERENMLLAIARAAEKNNVEFALPSIYYKSEM